ncbi:MAG: site-specific DNA-methyltransferase [Candidatus Aenigmatarchaeota archaeon]
MQKDVTYLADSRTMCELNDNSIDLIVTSPPYWDIKDYGTEEQIGFSQDLLEYLHDLNKVFSECARVLKNGRYICINIGDRFLKTDSKRKIRNQVIPLHAEIINMFMSMEFDYIGTILWHKLNNKNTSGGGSIMGSYPYPVNGVLEINYEHILVFRKYGETDKINDNNIKESSKLSLEEWKQYFNSIWNVQPERQDSHIAMFPLEIPKRLIKMYSYVNEIVLDPFAGSGTTLLAAKSTGRHYIGYEINPDYVFIIKNKVGDLFGEVKVIKREGKCDGIIYNQRYVANIISEKFKNNHIKI